MPKVVANDLGVSMSRLALLLGISYHTLAGWARRGSAPATLVAWLEVEYPKAKRKLIQELAVAHPIDATTQVTYHPRFTDPIPKELTLRKALGRPPRKERERRPR
jgi:hypothetical protein